MRWLGQGLTVLHLHNANKKEEALASSFYLNYNAYFDTGCKRLQSCIEMQPEMGMQPSNKREFI